jgi:hypothetical protein
MMSLELGAMLGLSSSGPGREHLNLSRREILDRHHEAPAVATARTRNPCRRVWRAARRCGPPSNVIRSTAPEAIVSR